MLSCQSSSEWEPICFQNVIIRALNDFYVSSQFYGSKSYRVFCLLNSFQHIDPDETSLTPLMARASWSFPEIAELYFYTNNKVSKGTSPFHAHVKIPTLINDQNILLHFWESYIYISTRIIFDCLFPRNQVTTLNLHLYRFTRA